MNENHAALCSSPEWAEFLTTDVLIPLTERLDLGEQLLELGPGYGAATRSGTPESGYRSTTA